MKIGMRFIALIAALLVTTALVSAAAETIREDNEIAVKEKEERLRNIIKEYNTIIIGKAKTVALDEDAPDKEHRWAVDVLVDEILLGNSIKGNRIKLFIHSPAKEFSYDADPVEIKNRKCVWALSVKDDLITKKEGVFSLQHFSDADVALLKRLIKEMNSQK